MTVVSGNNGTFGSERQPRASALASAEAALGPALVTPATGLLDHRDLGRLIVTCPDRPGIVAAVSRVLFDQGANIVHADQHSTAHGAGQFYMRIEFLLPDLVR